MAATDAPKQNVKHAIIYLRQMKSFCEKPVIITRASRIYARRLADEIRDGR